MQPQWVHFFLPCCADWTEQLLSSSSENNVLESPLGLLTLQILMFKSRPPRLLFSELVTLVTVTGEDVTLAPRGPFITSFYVNQPFTQGGGSPACLGFKTSGRLGVGERKPYT